MCWPPHRAARKRFSRSASSGQNSSVRADPMLICATKNRAWWSTSCSASWRPPMPDADRLGEVVCRVLEGALGSTGCAGIVILDDGSPEADLLGRWCVTCLGDHRTWRVTAEADAAAHAGESLRYLARIMARER